MKFGLNRQFFKSRLRNEATIDRLAKIDTGGYIYHNRSTAFMCMLAVMMTTAGCGQHSTVPNSMPLHQANPDLRSYQRFSITSQSIDKDYFSVAGMLSFGPDSASVYASNGSGATLGEMYLQRNKPEAESSEPTKKNFTISGTLSVGHTKFNCFVPIQMDIDVQFVYQPLIGTCQDRVGRISKIVFFQ
jgi:hypothetical protein